MKTCPKCGKEYEGANTLCPDDGAVLEKAGDALVGQILASKYRIEERISEGGMGTVYRATHILMEKTVAIKVLHPSLAADEKIVARFSREAKAASRISHPHAISVTDFGESENGVVFLVMEYLRGQTLKEIIRAEGPLPLPRVVEIIRQVSGALETAHAEGVVHRDLKSDNIMLEGVGNAQDWAKVLDFGIAKIKEPVGGQDPALTAPNLIIGTPQYMSPEQCSQASEIDARSDLYSLGVIIFEMLVGHVPFTGESPTAIMMKHLQEPAPSLLEERKDLPASVSRVVTRALSKRPEDRYQSASELSEALSLAMTNAEATATSAVAAATSVEPRRPSEHATNRIIVPTATNEPAPTTTASAEQDEGTIVRESRSTGRIEESNFAAPPSGAGFSPWRIIVPALVLLAVVFVMFYALQGDSGQPASENQTAPLTSDPNSRPVEPTAPPTGAGERNITPGTVAPVVSPDPATTAEGVPTTVTNINENSNTGGSPTPVEGANTNQNNNAGAPEAEQPSPSPANRNNNQRRTPPPARTNPPPVTVIPETPAPSPTPQSKPPEETPRTPPPAADSSPSLTAPDTLPMPD